MLFGTPQNQAHGRREPSCVLFCCTLHIHAITGDCSERKHREVRSSAAQANKQVELRTERISALHFECQHELRMGRSRGWCAVQRDEERLPQTPPRRRDCSTRVRLCAGLTSLEERPTRRVVRRRHRRPRTRGPSRRRVGGSHQGSAIWDASLRQDSHDWVEVGGDGDETPPKWEAIVASGRFRPTLSAMKAACKAAFACRRETGDVSPRCAELRCPTCWTNTGNLDSSTIQCSRYNHFASLQASSGTRIWKGGDARSAADYLKDYGPPDAWVLGEGGGQDVEVWRGTPPTGGDATASSSVEYRSMGKIVYFFKHRGGAREGRAEPGPETWWVLLFEYVSAGSGKPRLPDAVTQHPVMRLRG